MQTSYQGIRQTLVTLTVELEDKNKVAVVLERTIKQERELLVNVEVGINTQYESQFHLLQSEQHDIIEEQKNKINNLIVNKKTLLDNCKQLVEQLKSLDNDGRTKLQELSNHARQIIEQDKKTFKSSSDDRQRKVSVVLLL